jgi:hypothetical protein
LIRRPAARLLHHQNLSGLDQIVRPREAERRGTPATQTLAVVSEGTLSAQLHQKADESAKQLGYLIVRERANGEAAGADLDRLVNDIVRIKAQLADTGEAAVDRPGPGTSTSASEPAAGDFKLD